MKMKQIPTLIELPDAPVGDKIRYYRLQRSMTQKELAEKCGLNESTIRNYELGNRTPKQEIIEDIVPVRDVKLSLHIPEAVRAVRFALTGEEIPFVSDENGVSFTIKEFTCHTSIVIEY